MENSFTAFLIFHSFSQLIAITSNIVLYLVVYCLLAAHLGNRKEERLRVCFDKFS